MRTILFRGKWIGRDESKWVYGDLTHQQNTDRAQIVERSGRVWYVDTATVGQYTGVDDTNGTKIFEGDIVECNGDPCIVKFMRGCWVADYGDDWLYLHDESELTLGGDIYDLSFNHDKEKMRDFAVLTKKEFLASYSYLTEVEYDATAQLNEVDK